MIISRLKSKKLRDLLLGDEAFLYRVPTRKKTQLYRFCCGIIHQVQALNNRVHTQCSKVPNLGFTQLTTGVPLWGAKCPHNLYLYINNIPHIHRTDLADLSSFWKKMDISRGNYRNILYFLESEHLQLELTKFPVFSLCFDKISKFPVFSLTGNPFGHFPCFPCAVGTLLYIADVMLIWAPIIPATRWSCGRPPTNSNNW